MLPLPMATNWRYKARPMNVFTVSLNAGQGIQAKQN
jgi:hypothetical protein